MEQVKRKEKQKIKDNDPFFLFVLIFYIASRVKG